MEYEPAKMLIEKIKKMVESEGIDHHSITEERKGNQRYLELKVSIKIK